MTGQLEAPKVPPEEGDEDFVPEDDTVIGRAFRWSVLVFAVAFVIVAVALYLRSQKPPPAPPPVRTPVQAADQRRAAEAPAFAFRDVTRESGIDFVHYNGARGGKYLPETLGGGCAFFDYDGDGDQDILFVNSRFWPWDEAPKLAMGPQLYTNDGHGHFEGSSELAFSCYGMGVAVGDYDNDRDVDVFITAVGGNHLYRNDGGRFTDVTKETGVGGAADGWSTSAGFFDADNDGDLDLMVCNYIEWSKEIDEQVNYQLVGVGRAYGPPTNFKGTQVYFYRNDKGRFTEVGAEAGLHVKNRATGLNVAKSLGLSPFDLDDDGAMDVVIANDTTQKFLFHNQGNGTFKEIGEASGVAYSPEGTATGAMGIDSAHYRNDAVVAIGIGNFANEMTSFYVAGKKPLRFTDEAITEGIGPVSRPMLKFGLFFFDPDLDGRLDLLQANGHLEENIQVVQPGVTYRQPAQLFWNCGFDYGACFVPVPVDKCGDLSRPIVGRGAAYADIDGDGDLDVLLTQTGGAPMLLKNEQAFGNHWLRVKLRGNGTTTNRDAIGAKITVRAGDKSQVRCVMPTRSYLTQVELPVTFGLGPAAGPVSIEVVWPDRSRQKVDVTAVDREITIEQGP